LNGVGPNDQPVDEAQEDDQSKREPYAQGGQRLEGSRPTLRR
jgi:hypothetical protein